MHSLMLLFRALDAGRPITEPAGQFMSPPAVPTAPPPGQYSLMGHVLHVEEDAQFTSEGSM